MKYYENKIERERAWYTKRPGFAKRHFLNSRLFYSPARTAYANDYTKRQFAHSVAQVIQRQRLSEPRILIAPLGAGGDLPYLRQLSPRLTGIDVSAEAIGKVPDAGVEKHVGDMKNMVMFPDGTFDVVVMSQFFHHFLDFGFDAFLAEALRVLRPKGHLFALEPSVLHPVAFAAQCAKKVVGNITGTVEDEAPFNPVRLSRAMVRTGFVNVSVFALNYSHHRTPLPVAKLTNFLLAPLRNCPGLKCFAYACGFYGQKP